MSQPITPHHTIIFVCAGMWPDAISRIDTPSLYALRQGGVNLTDNHNTGQTFTTMNVGSTGFYGNTQWSPGASGKNASGSTFDFQQPVFSEDYAVLQDLDAFYR